MNNAQQMTGEALMTMNNAQQMTGEALMTMNNAQQMAGEALMTMNNAQQMTGEALMTMNDAKQMTMFDSRRPERLHRDFFVRDVLEVAPSLLGKILVRSFDDGSVGRFTITETEAYRGDGDQACHASRGKTARNEVMFREGGLVYVYFIYGMYWMLNVVTGYEGDASAVLIRGVEGVNGPGRVGKILHLDRSFYGENLSDSQRLWVEDSPGTAAYTKHPRVGIHYAGEPWISMPWRFILI